MLVKTFDPKLLQLATTSNELVVFPLDTFLSNPKRTCLHFFIDLKIQIERWDLVTEYLYIHPDTMKLLESILYNEINVFNYVKSIWGISIIETDLMPTNNVLFSHESKIYTHSEYANRNLCLGILDYNFLKKALKLIPFW